MSPLEQTVEDHAKCFLLAFGDDKPFGYGRVRIKKVLISCIIIIKSFLSVRALW